MYGFGGLELMSYNYTDAEWDAYVASQGGTLNYK
jgi:oligopeptide transport system substrate-binding protein